MENSQWGLVACFGLVWGSSPGHPPPLAPLAPPLLSIASQRPKGQNPENPGFSRPLVTLKVLMKANDEKAGGAEAKFQKAKQKRLI